jgi:hypothetical protein
VSIRRENGLFKHTPEVGLEIERRKSQEEAIQHQQ